MKNSTETINILKDKQREQNFAEDVCKGLSDNPKRISSKYFYDERGSLLFEKIMELPEYYPTRCEKEIFETYKSELLQLMQNKPFNLVDLGAGDGKKTQVLIEHFLNENADFHYFPIDISDDILEILKNYLHQNFSKVAVTPVVAEYFDALKWLGQQDDVQKLVLFMGGNIGNFSKPAAHDFLCQMRENLNSGDLLLVGFDLKKDPRIIRNAYDDKQGVTAEFNFNLLIRMNNELGADFNLENWQHYASYDPISGAVQSYLIPEKEQLVKISTLNTEFYFEAWEPIHTEYSFKYSAKEVENLAKSCGFKVETHFFSSRNYFMDSVWRVG